MQTFQNVEKHMCFLFLILKDLYLLTKKNLFFTFFWHSSFRMRKSHWMDQVLQRNFC